jgi:hypothetical protein
MEGAGVGEKGLQGEYSAKNVNTCMQMGDYSSTIWNMYCRLDQDGNSGSWRKGSEGVHDLKVITVEFFDELHEL